MSRRPSRAAGVATLALIGSALASGLPAAEAAPAGTDYTWVGSSVAGGGDNHSWTDARNWQPQGVPVDGDSASISPVGRTCRAAVTGVPDGLALTDLALTGSQDCTLSVSGGSVTIRGAFTWETGVLDTPIDLATGAAGVLSGDDHGATDERLSQPLTVHGSLDLHETGLSLDNGVTLTVAPHGTLTVSVASALTAASCCTDPARLVNDGTVSVGASALLLTQLVEVEQRGLISVPDSSDFLSRGAPITAAAGSRYAGSGRWTWFNDSDVTLEGSQLLRRGFHLELGNDGTTSSQLGGFGQLTGRGSLDWTGGTIAAGLSFGPTVSWHIYGPHTRIGQRYLSGLATKAQGSAQTVIAADGPVVVDQDAAVTLRHHVVLTLTPSASLTLAPGTRLVGRTKTGDPDAIFTSGTSIRVPSGEEGSDPATLDNVELYTEGGTTSVAPGSELQLSGSARSTLAHSVYAGGGVFAVAAPVDTITELGFEGGTILALRPGGSLDGSTSYAGDGVLDWTGGELSGDVSLDLTRIAVRGPHVKSVSDVGGSTSFVQMLGPVTFNDGTVQRHNVVDLHGNSLVTFVGARIGHDVELTDGDFANSTSPLVVDPGAGLSTYTDAGLHLFSSGSVTVQSGVFAISGPYTDNADTEVAAGATVRLTDSDHPLELSGGSLSGAGLVSGVIVNSGGVLEPTSVPDSPLRLNGSYTQTPGGRLVLDLAQGSRALRVHGSFMLMGDVIYANQADYAPRVGDLRRLISADVFLDWRPGCEQTTGRASGRGHWVSSVEDPTVRATFVRGPSGTC